MHFPFFPFDLFLPFQPPGHDINRILPDSERGTDLHAAFRRFQHIDSARHVVVPDRPRHRADVRGVGHRPPRYDPPTGR
jgi:hypothetical protein